MIQHAPGVSWCWDHHWHKTNYRKTAHHANTKMQQYCSHHDFLSNSECMSNTTCLLKVVAMYMYMSVFTCTWLHVIHFCCTLLGSLLSTPANNVITCSEFWCFRWNCWCFHQRMYFIWKGCEGQCLAANLNTVSGIPLYIYHSHACSHKLSYFLILNILECGKRWPNGILYT